MTFLIAVTGLSGAGKTTAVNYLKNFARAEKVYLGQFVLDEVRARGLPFGPENERTIRLDLRAHHGPGALAVLATPVVQRFLRDGIHVLLDAVFELAEYEQLKKCCENADLVLLAIEAPFDIRARRLSERAERPYTPQQLRLRDETECARLGTDKVMATAANKIINESSMQLFENQLQAFWDRITR